MAQHMKLKQETAMWSGSCCARGRGRSLMSPCWRNAQQQAWRSRRRPSSTRSAQRVQRGPPRARALTLCRLPSTTPA
eukprot:3967339-Pleurochrysis_carterae.AAC.2